MGGQAGKPAREGEAVELEGIKEFQNSVCAWLRSGPPAAPAFSSDREVVSGLIPELKAVNKQKSALYLEQLLKSGGCATVELGRKELCELTVDIELLIMARTIAKSGSF